MDDRTLNPSKSFLISKILQPVPGTSSYRLRMPVSSAMDGNMPLAPMLESGADSHPCDWIPAIHAGMTAFLSLAETSF